MGHFLEVNNIYFNLYCFYTNVQHSIKNYQTKEESSKPVKKDEIINIREDTDEIITDFKITDKND